MWRGGCIIRRRSSATSSDAFDANPNLDEPPARRLTSAARSRRAEAGWRRAVARAAQTRHPGAGVLGARSPSTTATGSERLPANLIQAQRDYFGAHTYERVDRPRGQFFHTNWK